MSDGDSKVEAPIITEVPPGYNWNNSGEQKLQSRPGALGNSLPTKVQREVLVANGFYSPGERTVSQPVVEGSEKVQPVQSITKDEDPLSLTQDGENMYKPKARDSRYHESMKGKRNRGDDDR